jgi:hypothetical protein
MNKAVTMLPNCPMFAVTLWITTSSYRWPIGSLPSTFMLCTPPHCTKDVQGSTRDLWTVLRQCACLLFSWLVWGGAFMLAVLARLTFRCIGTKQNRLHNATTFTSCSQTFTGAVGHPAESYVRLLLAHAQFPETWYSVRLRGGET